jgi:hypothetical protein
MTGASRIFCVAVMATTVSGAAAAQTVTAFDGTYAGVSRNVQSSGSNCGVFAPELRPLTIRNGVAQFEAGLQGATAFQGNISAQGDLTMRDNLSDQIIAKVDQNGKATGSIALGGANCVISAVWQKQ